MLSALSIGAMLAGRRFLPRLPVPLLAVVAAIAASAAFDFAGRGIATLGPIRGGLPDARRSDGELDRGHRADSGRGIVLPHHRRAERGDRARDGGPPPRAGRRERRHPRACRRRTPRPPLSGAFVVNGSPTQTAMGERAGATSQLAQLAAAVGRRRGPALSHRTAPVPAALRAGGHRLHDRGRADRRRGSSPTSAAKAPESSRSRSSPRRRSRWSASSRGSCSPSGCRSRATSATAIGRTPACSRPTRRAGGCRRSAAAGIETEPGLIVYRFGADLFYANEARFTDEIRDLVKNAPVPVRWLVVDAGAITDVDYSAARSVRDLCDDLHAAGVGLVFARVRPYLKADMDRHGITAVVGEEHIFETLHEGLAFVRGSSRLESRLTARSATTTRSRHSRDCTMDRPEPSKDVAASCIAATRTRADTMPTDVPPMTDEEKRLEAARAGKAPWRRFGPYVSERQWGTVREDYSADGIGLGIFSARPRALARLPLGRGRHRRHFRRRAAPVLRARAVERRRSLSSRSGCSA